MLKVAFPDPEEREFLVEMLEPELHESHSTLVGHSSEVFENVNDIEAWSNTMGRQGRRIKFIDALFKALEAIPE